MEEDARSHSVHIGAGAGGDLPVLELGKPGRKPGSGGGRGRKSPDMELAVMRNMKRTEPAMVTNKTDH